MRTFTDRWEFECIFRREDEKDKDQYITCMVRKFKYV